MEREDLEGVEHRPSRDESKGANRLVVHLGGLDVRRDRVGGVPELANVRGSMGVNALGKVVV